MKKVCLYIGIILFLFCYQLAIAPRLPFGVDQMNLWLVAVVFIAIAFEFYQGVAFALISAFLFDLFSTLPFGAIMIAISITLAAVYIVCRRFLTNKSLYAAMVLTALATAVYSLVLFFYTAVTYFATTNDAGLVYRLGLAVGGDFLRQMALNLAMVSLLFLIFHASSQRFSAVFVDTIKTK